VYLAGGVLERDLGEHSRVGLVRHVRAEADPDVEGPVDLQLGGRTNLVHGFAFQADEERKGVAVLFDANARGHGATVTGFSFNTIRFLDVGALLRTHLR